MKLFENDLVEQLIDLKENHGILGIKAEFEDEGASFEEVLYLKKITLLAGLDLTIKIGGCGALNDLNQVEKFGCSAIIAPMIESSYALKKFVSNIKTVFKNSKTAPPQLYINIETISGYNNLSEILSGPETNDIKGIVLGRFDMAKSIGLACKDCDGEQLFEIAKNVAIKAKQLNKTFVIGGGVKEHSIDFFNKLSGYIDRFETRKIIFDADYSLKNKDYEGILKAIRFEIAWIKAKKDLCGFYQEKDLIRISSLEERSENVSQILYAK